MRSQANAMAEAIETTRSLPPGIWPKNSDVAQPRLNVVAFPSARRMMKNGTDMGRRAAGPVPRPISRLRAAERRDEPGHQSERRPRELHQTGREGHRVPRVGEAGGGGRRAGGAAEEEPPGEGGGEQPPSGAGEEE